LQLPCNATVFMHPRDFLAASVKSS